jgi:hypothetical protein
MGDLLLCRRRGCDVAIEADVQSCMIVAQGLAEYNEDVQCGATLQDEMESETDSVTLLGCCTSCATPGWAHRHDHHDHLDFSIGPFDSLDAPVTSTSVNHHRPMAHVVGRERRPALSPYLCSLDDISCKLCGH